MDYRRLIPLITPILIWLLSQTFFWRPDFFYSALAGGILLIILSIRYLVGAKNSNSPRGEAGWLLFIISPILFFLSFSGYATIIIGHFWIQLIFLLELWFLFSYLRVVYYYVNHSSSHWPPRLDNLLISGGFLTVFAAAALLFGLPIFLNWPSFMMILIFTIIISLLFWQFNLLRESSAPVATRLLLIVVLILTELFLVFTLLPLNFNILGLFTAIIYYLGLTIIRLEYYGKLNRQAIKLPLILSIILIFILLVTARWL